MKRVMQYYSVNCIPVNLRFTHILFFLYHQLNCRVWHSRSRPIRLLECQDVHVVRKKNQLKATAPTGKIGGISTSVSATDLRRDLHWLPIRQRFIYKLSVLTHKALHTGQRCYLADLIDSYEPSMFMIH